MYSEEHEDPLYTKLSKILELTSLIFGHYEDTGQKERAHSLIVWVVSDQERFKGAHTKRKRDPRN